MSGAPDRLRPGGLDPRRLRREFPIYQNNPGLVFLDSGASAQKQQSLRQSVSSRRIYVQSLYDASSATFP